MLDRSSRARIFVRSQILGSLGRAPISSKAASDGETAVPARQFQAPLVVAEDWAVRCCSSFTLRRLGKPYSVDATKEWHNKVT